VDEVDEEGQRRHQGRHGWREGEKALSGKHPFGVRRVSAQVCYRTVAAALSHAATVMFPFSLVRTGRPPKYGLACASAS
jgi:hypothetical protein